MITLTTPKAVATVLGGSTTVNYDKLVMMNATYDIIALRISGQLKLVCSADGSQQPIFGTYTIDAAAQTVTVSFPQLPFQRTIVLTAGQVTTVDGWISGAQNQLEAGLINVGEIAGTQSSGT
jgi:hypothetical protein